MGQQKTNYTFLMALAVAILLPLTFYLITKALSKDKIHMPRYYAVDSVVSRGDKLADSIYHRVADLRLTNQLGQTISIDSDLSGKVLVVDFFYVNCPNICPRLTADVSMLQGAFRHNPKLERNLDGEVQFISITVDPAADSFPALRAYADRYHVNHDHWWFLTGDKKTIYNFARNELRLSVGPGDGGADDFIHTEKLVLLDKNRHIRGYYDGLDTTALRKCADDIVLLTMEKDKTPH